MNSEELEKETIQYIENTNREYRKSKGQYFTPKILREALLEQLPRKVSPRILDPGCGTGEFLLTAKEYFEKPALYGWEIDQKLAEISRKLVPEAQIECTDTLIKNENEKYDFVIGNPPYYELDLAEEVKEAYRDIIKGRINIYALFVYKGIKLLKEGGYLAYVVPPSMNNGAYFAKLREFIINQCNIEYLAIQEAPHLFHDALQSVMLLVLKKGKNKGNYLFKKNGITIFSERSIYLKEAFSNQTTLQDLGYQVRTGRLVWNQNKDLLTKDSNNGVPLIWSHNIKRGRLELNNHKKPQFVRISTFDSGPAIVVNRVVGRPGKGRIKAALIPEKMKFVAENHVNVISDPEQQRLNSGKRQKRSSWGEILDQLNSPEKVGILQSITGNTQISKTELENLFPIDITL